MSLIVEDIRTSSPLTGAGDQTSFLVDNMGDIITIEIDVRTETYKTPETESTTDPSKFFIITNPGSNLTGKLKDDRAIYISDLTGWGQGFVVGATFTIQGLTDSGGINNKSGTIIEISDDGQTIITDQNFAAAAEIFPLEAYVGIITPITAITHKHGFIGNTEPRNYISKVDGSEQISQLGGLDYTNLVYEDATLLGNKSWQSGSIQIKGNGIGEGNPSLATGVIQAFTIKHEIVTNPLMLADEWQDILDGIKPDILLNEASLRYVFSIDAAPILKNPNQTTNVIFDEFTGNIGWRNENFNGGPTNYSISNVVYSRVPSGEIIDSLELTTNETKITFTVTNDIDSPFSSGNTKAIFKYNFAPSDQSQYRDDLSAISETMEYNFMFDDVMSTLGSGSGTPRYFGTESQVIKSLATTYVSNDVITVEVRVQLSSENVSRLSGLVDRRYQIYFSVADHTLSRADSDKVSLTIDNNDYYLDLSDPNMFITTHSFMEHTGSIIGTDDKAIITARAEDDVACIASIVLDKSTRIEDEIELVSATAQIIARKDSNTFFVVDNYTTNLDLTSVTDATYGGIPFVDDKEDRGFATPADDLRKFTVLKRRTGLDGGGLFYYELVLPTVLRWEYWEANEDVNDEFFDTNQPNNGKNEDWMRILSFSGWKLCFRTSVGATKNGNALAPFEKETQIFTEDYLEGTEWDTETEKTFIDSTGDPIFQSPNYGVSLAENTRFEGDMTYIAPSPPTLPDLVDVVKINVFERGNFKEQFTASTLYPLHVNTKWLSIETTDEGGGVWRVTAVLDHSKLGSEESFKITHRRYDTRQDSGIPDGMLTEDSILMETENGTIMNIETV